MFTYFLIGLPFVVAALILDLYVLRTKVIYSRQFLQVMAVMLVLTAVFNQLLTGLPVYEYNGQRISGLRLGFMPIEDFMYTIAAVIGVGSVRKRYGQGKS